MGLASSSEVWTTGRHHVGGGVGTNHRFWALAVFCEHSISICGIRTRKVCTSTDGIDHGPLPQNEMELPAPTLCHRDELFEYVCNASNALSPF
jgi:hypothetical protein